MNTILKAISCGVILTTVSPAADHEDPELAAAIAASLADHQSAQEALAMQESVALAASLADHQRAQETATIQESAALAASLADHQSVLEAAAIQESAALAASLEELQRAQAQDDARLAQRNRLIAADFELAHQLAGKEDTREIDKDLQQALYQSTIEAADDSDMAAALSFSLQIQPAQDKAILIKAIEALTAGTSAKNIALKAYFENTSNLLKQELDKDDAMAAGIDPQHLNLEIGRLQRAKARNAVAFTQAMNSPEQLITFKNLLQIKFSEFSEIQIQQILAEIQK